MADTFQIPRSIKKVNYDGDGRITSSYESEDPEEILSEIQKEWPADYRRAFTEARRKLDESRAREGKLMAQMVSQIALLDTYDVQLTEALRIIRELQKRTNL